MKSIDDNVTGIEIDQEATDPRVVAVSNALYESRDSWVSMGDDSTIQFDIEEIAKAAILANDQYASADPMYCRWECHIDEEETIIAILNEEWAKSGLPVAILSGIVDRIKDSIASIIAMEESTDNRME